MVNRPEQRLRVRCVIGFHKWDGCVCIRCGTSRTEGHDWNKNCEACSKCGYMRSDAHKWRGCKCCECGANREESHDWSKNCERCATCGFIRHDTHVWSGCICRQCGITRDAEHNWKKNCGKCSVCGATRINSHQWDATVCWDGSVCKVCGVWRHACIRCHGTGKEWRSALHGGGHRRCKDCGALVTYNLGNWRGRLTQEKRCK